MSQLSFCWSCTAVGDGGPTSYSVEVVEAINRLYGNVTIDETGVIYWTDTAIFPGFVNAIGGTPDDEFFLFPEYVGLGLLRIHPGAALVQGWVFINDDDVDFNINGGNANATDVIGLRRDLAGQTVRLFHGQGGVGATYALVQTNATWEIPLVEITLDGSGNYSSHEDVRKFAQTPLYPAQKREIFLTALDAFDDAGSIVTRREFGSFSVGSSTTYQGLGVILDDGGAAGRNIDAFTDRWVVPHDCINGEFNVTPLFSVFNVAGVGDFRLQMARWYVGGAGVTNFQWIQAEAGLNTVGDYYSGVNWRDLNGGNLVLTPGDTVQLSFGRVPGAIDDTSTNDIVFYGFKVTYNARQSPTFDRDLPLQ